MPGRRRQSRRSIGPGRPIDPFDPFDGPVADTLDIHGFSASETREAIPQYLARVRKQHPGGLIHVITGRGRGSHGRPVLKGVIKSLLTTGHPAVKQWTLDQSAGGYLIRLTGGR